MKELNKLRLINWHLFANDTVDIKNITFLTGSNGTGKSTIIDAMQIVLLGDTSGRNFNKAANEKTGRSLRGYLRCETGETSQGQIMCLRPGRFTSYIAMQFKDTSTDKEFTLGIVFDCYEDDKEEHRFFFLDDSFPENNFTNKDKLDNSIPRPLSYKELLKFFQDNYKSNQYQFFDTNVAYQNFLKKIFGDLPDKYLSLFKKAVSFTPITNISSFITEFVCDIDYNVDISSMRNNIEQYKLLEVEAKKIQVKIDALTAIKSAYDNLQKAKQDKLLADYITDRANYEASKAELEKYKKDLENNNARIMLISKLLQEKDEQINELKSESESYLAKKVGSSGYSLTSSISSKKNSILEKIASLESNYQSLALTLKSYIKQYNEALFSLSNRLNNFDDSILSDKEADMLEDLKDAAIDFNSICSELNSGLDTKNVSKDLLIDFQSQMASIHSLSIRMTHLLENSIANYSDKVRSINGEIDAIHSGHKPYNPTYLQIRETLKDELNNKYSYVDVTSFCDVWDIKDKKWTKAIEAYIYSQKFNLFVEDKYYEEAAKILARICKQYNVYNISLVDTRKLIERNFECSKNSVAEEIITSNKGARAYANFLLGKVKKCDTFNEARESGNGLLTNCTGYRNFASFYLDERKGNVPFIGTKVSEDSEFSKSEDLNAISKKLDLYNDLNSYLKSVSLLEVISSSEINTYVSDIESMSSINSYNEEIERLEQQLAEGDLKEVSSYDKKINDIQADIKLLEDEKSKLLIEQGALESTNKTLTNDLIPTKNIAVSMYADKLLKFDQTAVNEKYAPFFDKAMESMPLSKIKQEAQSTYVQMQNREKNAKDKLFDLRSKYTIVYNLSYDTTKEDTNQDFDKELDDLQTVMLPSYLKQIESAHSKAIKEFKDDFIYKLRNSFETIKSQIDDLNLALKDVKFGRDSYRFSVEPNKDYMEYYRMITDDLLLNVGDAEDIYLEKYGPIMDNLFSLISDSVSSNNTDAAARQEIIANIEKFTDYRTYLVFDLLVKRGNNDTESSLARTFKRQSGGETQTPFYISILASFAQLYRTNDTNADTIRLVIFDEAFSKMDGSRIKEAVSLLRSFGLQAILSTPTEKVTDLVNEVDQTLVVMHDVKRNRSRIDRYQDKRKLVQQAN